MNNTPDEKLLTPAQVARMFGVDPKTVTRWGKSGHLSVVRTPGGHRRYLRSEVLAYMTPTRAEREDAGV